MAQADQSSDDQEIAETVSLTGARREGRRVLGGGGAFASLVALLARAVVKELLIRLMMSAIRTLLGAVRAGAEHDAGKDTAAQDGRNMMRPFDGPSGGSRRCNCIVWSVNCCCPWVGVFSMCDVRLCYVTWNGVD